MASVFLSYVREDADRARSLAGLLERAGHSVWWDRHIKGGAQYSSEIETALNAADKVVVLWSAKSVGSAWVRDEAAAGRDTGRLIPVTLDATSPPLGFRQFQTIDLAAWKGRSPPANLKDLLDAVGGENHAAAAPLPKPRRALPLSAITIAIAILVFIAAGAWWWSGPASASPPTVAVKGVNAASNEDARQLALRLGQLESARGDDFRLVTGESNADLIVELGATNQSDRIERDVAIRSGKDRSILWSSSLQQPPANRDGLSQQLTLTTERVLSCALEALSDARTKLDSSTLKQYLGGCSRLASVYGTGDFDPALAALFEQVVAKAPRFAGAWSRLLQTEIEVVRLADPPSGLVAKLRDQIRKARSLGVDIGEIYAAEGVLLPSNDFLGQFALLDRAVQADPENPYLLRLRSERLQGVGRMSDSIADARSALQLDPLSPALMSNYSAALAYGGKIDAAFAQQHKAEAAWPSAENLRNNRYALDLRFGDPKEALTLLHQNASVNGNPAQETFLRARIEPTPGNITRAINDERQHYAQDPRAIYSLLQALGAFGRKDQAIDELLRYTRPDAVGYNSEVFFRPPMREVWRDPRSMAAAAHVGLLQYWVKSGKWPDFCFDPTLPYDCKVEAAKFRV
jgi:tetratricopeptide (TPR) repeat protein